MSSTESDNVANPEPTDPNKTPPQTSAESQVPDNTPIGQKHSSLRTGGFHKGQRKKELAEMEMSSRMAEISYPKFMEMLRARSKEFGPEDATLKELDRGEAQEYLDKLNKFKYDEDNLKEDDFYPLLCQTIKGMFDLAKAQLSPGPGNHTTPRQLDIVETALRADLVEQSGTSGAAEDPGDDSPNPEEFQKKVDLSIYRESDAAPGTPGSYRIKSLTGPHLSRAASKVDRRKWFGRSRWSLMKSFLEIKKDSAAPFSLRGFLFDTRGTKEGRAQIAGYAAEIRLRQHRVFLYSVSVHRHTARLVYWDQAGVLVSESLDFKANPYDFLNFFYILGQMDDTQLGLDPSVTPATEEDEKLWDSLYNEENNEYLHPRLDAARRQPLVRVAVNGDSLETAAGRWQGQTLPPSPTRTFLIGMYAFGHNSLTGRGTRGYIALDVVAKSFVYLKDYWRVVHEKVRPEMVIYAHLHGCGVEYIADIVCGGDVYSRPSVVQGTQSQEHIVPQYRPHVHTRIVILQIGRRLNEFKNTRELALATRDALRAHQQAWEKAKVLHRDINDGNIIIDDTTSPWTARLIDWEQAKFLEDLNQGATNVIRSGTWAFLSGLVTLFPQKKYELADDLESFLQLLIWMTWRFCWHQYSQKPTDLTVPIATKYFAIRESPEGYQRGYDAKITEIRLGASPFPELASPAYNDLLDALMKLFQKHYGPLDNLTLSRAYDHPSAVRPRKLSASLREEAIEKVENAYKNSPLRTHDEMLEIFDDVLRRDVCCPPVEASGDYDWVLSDKVPDQFKDIPDFQITMSTTKRGSTHASEEVDARAVKRVRA